MIELYTHPMVKFGLDAPDVASAVRTYRQTILDMEAALSNNSWVTGADVTLADICLMPYFQTLLQFGWTDLYQRDCPGVSNWIRRAQQRPSCQVAVAGCLSHSFYWIMNITAGNGVHAYAG